MCQLSPDRNRISVGCARELRIRLARLGRRSSGHSGHLQCARRRSRLVHVGLWREHLERRGRNRPNQVKHRERKAMTSNAFIQINPCLFYSLFNKHNNDALRHQPRSVLHTALHCGQVLSHVLRLGRHRLHFRHHKRTRKCLLTNDFV